MTNYFDVIERLFSYCRTRFPDPEEGWSEEKINTRSYEQIFSEILILDCLEDVTREPYDVIFDKAMYYEYVLGRLEPTSLMIDAYKCAMRTSHILLSFLNLKENR